MFPASASKAVPIDPDLWRACAGSNVSIPQVGAKVYYFPEGHAEQCDSPLAPMLRNIFPCRVLHVRYFIDRVTDEPSAAISLQQLAFAPPCRSLAAAGETDVRRGDGSRIDSFMKVLTQSDANNGGGFSVPRQCAESIFPPLNYQEDPPVQNLTISDVQGGHWVFRHIYRGKPKRHLLTTGWSKFVNHKKLIGGDTIIFMRHSLTRKMYIGIRRLRNNKNNKGNGGRRSLNSPRFVEEAAMRAARGLPFEVVIYPRSGMSDFVVNADLVDRALNFRWAVGMRVKMDIAAEDPSRRTCLLGHVSLVKNSQDSASLWKILQVTWVEPEHMQNVEMLNPWQVECVDHSMPFHRINLPSDLLVPRIYHPSNQYMTGQRALWLGMRNHQTSSNSNASLQGAKHLSHISNIVGGDNTHHRMPSEDRLQMGNMSLLRSRLTDSNLRRSFGAEVGIPCRIMARDGNNSIQLFGKLICVENPGESQPVDASSLETYDSKVDGNEAE